MSMEACIALARGSVDDKKVSADAGVVKAHPLPRSWMSQPAPRFAAPRGALRGRAGVQPTVPVGSWIRIG